MRASVASAAGVFAVAALAIPRSSPAGSPEPPAGSAKNVILFVGDGMGVSTVTATRIFSVGVDGELAMDQFPYTALSRTHTADHLTGDSAGTMTAMMTGVNANSGVLGFGADTERGDFLGDGDGAPLTTVLEMAKAEGMRVGLVTTTRVTHATPAACFAKSNERNREDDLVLQALPGDARYNPRLGGGIDLIAGGGRREFLPDTVTDAEGDPGVRSDGRDLVAEFQAAGYTFVWEESGWNALGRNDLPVLALFESSHMEHEHDRPTDLGGEPSLEAMTRKAIELLGRANPDGYFLMVEGGRIDHAHHAGNAYRSLTETEEFDQAIAAALEEVDLQDTLVVVTADHSHVFTVGGNALRPREELPYPIAAAPPEYDAATHGNVLSAVFRLQAATGDVEFAADRHGVPYTVLLYGNGPGHRAGSRVSPWSDPFPGYGGTSPSGPEDPDYVQEAAVPLYSETHGAEEVSLYAWGPKAHLVNGTAQNTVIFHLMRLALGL